MPSKHEIHARNRKRMPALDGVRGIAILAVFVFHYGITSRPNSLVRLVRVIEHFGWTGVDLFFVLSGFLITGILYDTRNDKGYFANFYARRALRLFPLIYGLAIVLLLLTPVLHLRWKIAQLGFLFYGANIIAYVDPSLNGIPPYFVLSHLWSLAVEEQFYLVWPLLVYFIPNRVRLIKACSILIGTALLLRIVLHLSAIVKPPFLYLEMPCRMDSLAIGSLIALLLRGGSNEKLRRLGPLLFGGGFVAVAITISIAHSMDWTSPPMLTVGFTLVALMYAGLILVALRDGSYLNRLCSNRFLRRCGEYSYGIYVYHLLINPLLRRQLGAYVSLCHSTVAGEVLWMIGSFLIIFCISAASFHLYEKPWMSLKSKFSYKTAVKTVEL